MMENKEIEKRLASALEAAAPDMLDDLLSEIEMTEKAEVTAKQDAPAAEKKEYRKAKARGRSLRPLISIAAAFVLMIGGFSVWRNMERGVFATVDIDVNPSIELSVNRNDKVIGVRPVNSEGGEILAGMDLKGSDLNTACNAVVGSMLTKGYLNDKTNSLLLSVSTDNEAKGREMEKQLTNGIGSYMDSSSVPAAVMGQFVREDKSLDSFAEKNGISAGKAALIRRLLSSGSRNMTEESLLSLSTQELIVLGQERDLAGDEMHGKAYTGQYIGYDAALEAALAKEGLDGSQISGTEVEMDCENGVIIYEVEFRHGGFEYEFEVDATTGEVIASEKEAEDDEGADADDPSDDDGQDHDDDETDDDHDDNDRDDDD